MKNIMGLGLIFTLTAAGGAWAAQTNLSEIWHAEWLAKRGGAIAEAPRKEDRAEDVADEIRWDNLEAMDAAGAGETALKQGPWSDSYWPHYAGGIAYRYADPGMKKEKDWEKNERYVVNNLGRGFPGEPSPAEKYDRLVGDGQYTLTRWSLAQGRKYFEKDGKVETWMGLCHGWAPASFMEEKVTKAIELAAPDGEKILFYPSDLHALASLLWAEGKFPMKLIGGRCNEKEPARDEQGRPKTPDCLDTNPGTFHLALFNQLAAAGRPLILDASADNEVWNYPVYRYESHYGKDGGAKIKAWREAARPISEEDRARAPRAEGATLLVPVVTTISYAVPREPSAALEPEPNLKVDTTYAYELEVNNDGKILGGEWLSKDHPDFLWVPGKGAKAQSAADLALDEAGDASAWREGAPLPESWRARAKESSAVGQPLGRIVAELLRRGR